jgi:hypothetical protein
MHRNNGIPHPDAFVRLWQTCGTHIVPRRNAKIRLAIRVAGVQAPLITATSTRGDQQGTALCPRRQRMGAMNGQHTLREQIESREALDTVSTPQRVCLGIAALGGIALIAIVAYTMRFMS